MRASFPYFLMAVGLGLGWYLGERSSLLIGFFLAVLGASVGLFIGHRIARNNF